VATAWFAIIALMLTVYVVLDGFDFGAGMVHLFVAKTDAERRTVLSSIGPLWDGNEVWLVASGGVLVFAFPKAYAVAFSGFYLPIMMALWLLILRGVAIELRSHHENPLWRRFWDVVFALASTMVAVVLGLALGNVVRGVPIGPGGYFNAPLFTSFRPGTTALGAIDWYTSLVGLFALVALAGHGALYLVWKTTGPVQARSRAAARRLWLLVVILGITITVVTDAVRPELLPNLGARPWAWPLVFLVPAAIATVVVALRRRRELLAFCASAAMLAGLLGAAAAALYPTILRSTIDESLSLDVSNAAAGDRALALGLAWWVPAIVLAVVYFAYLFRSFRGKVSPGGAHY
jgi:cytochrome bd ubiquinol oxidase subunit II